MSKRLIHLPIEGGRGAAKVEKTTSKDSFEAIRSGVGGSISMLAQGTGWEAYVDDEGLNKNLPLNEAAAYLLHHLDASRGAEWIWGPAVFVFNSEKSKAFQKANEWFEKYQAGTLSEDEEDTLSKEN
jgi:hypothetical protein